MELLPPTTVEEHQRLLEQYPTQYISMMIKQLFTPYNIYLYSQCNANIEIQYDVDSTVLANMNIFEMLTTDQLAPFKITYNNKEYKTYMNVMQFILYDERRIADALIACDNELKESQKRTQERTRSINANGDLFRIYAEKTMNPVHFQPLIDDENKDIDSFMEAYVNSL